MRVCDGVAVLELGGRREFCPVLLWDGDHLVLVDAGLPQTLAALQEAVAQEGRQFAEITDVILTHQDIDHIGCVKDILAESAAKVVAHKLEAPYLDGRETPVKLAALEAAGEDLPAELKAVRDNLRAGFAARRFGVDKTVEHGEVLPICGGLRVVHTPGHTPGHICLYRERDGMLIAGDALNLENGVLTGPKPEYTQDLGQAVRSLERLQPLEIRTVLCYHGGLFQGDVRSALAGISARSDSPPFNL